MLIAHLPPDSALARAAEPNPQWQVSDVLLAHIWQAVAHSKKPHPMLAAEYRRVTSATAWRPGRDRVLAAARRRAAQRRQDIADGIIT